jgi:hypothetical protein
MLSVRRAALSIPLLAGVLVALGVLSAPPLEADPLPGFSLDPVQLEQRMEDCLAGAVDDKYLLMGWINLGTGEQHRWYCSSLKHMYIRAAGGNVHDPLGDVNAFMQCVDRTVSHGFPRPGDPGNRNLIYQYMGTARRAVVVVNASTGDIVTIYTAPADDWATCAGWNP